MDERLRTDPWNFGELTGKLPFESRFRDSRNREDCICPQD
jgi:hypothetical protein